MDPVAADLARLRVAFDRAAPRYDGAAALHQEVGRRLVNRLDLIRLQPDTVLDLGCATGAGAAALKRRWPRARVLAAELAPSMLQRTRARSRLWRPITGLCAAADALPLTDASCQLVYSNLALQWWQDPAPALREVQRVLAPEGLFLFTTLGPDTLAELRASWAAVDGAGHVLPFLDMHDVGDALVRARLAGPVLDVERFTLTYPDLGALMRELRDCGSTNTLPERRRGLVGRRTWQQVAAGYECWRTAGRLPATFEVVYGHAWGTGARAADTRDPAAVTFPLSRLRRSRPTRS